MAKAIYETNSMKKAIVGYVEQLVDLSEIAKGIECTIAIHKDSTPTISFKVDELPLRVEKDKYTELQKKYTEAEPPKGD